MLAIFSAYISKAEDHLVVTAANKTHFAGDNIRPLSRDNSSFLLCQLLKHGRHYLLLILDYLIHINIGLFVYRGWCTHWRGL